MLPDLETPLTALKTFAAFYLTFIGSLAALHKVIRKTYRSLVVKVLFKLLIVSAVVSFCALSMIDNLGLTAYLELKYKYDELKMGYEITRITNDLDNVYKKIGQSVYNKQNADDLLNEAVKYNVRLATKYNEITSLDQKFREKMMFENNLKNMFSSKVSARCAAIKNMDTLVISESLPYLELCLLDPEPAVRREVMAFFETVNRQNSESLIPAPEPAENGQKPNGKS